MPTEPSSFPEVLAHRAASADRVALRFLPDGQSERIEWTYRDLQAMATRIAVQVQRRGLAGRRILLTLEPGLGYIAALFGILQAGAVAVPSFPPAGKRALTRLASIFNDCLPDLIICNSRVAAGAQRAAASLDLGQKSAEWLVIDDDFFASNPAAQPAEVAAAVKCQAEAPALLQYTSGSTGTPKGVIVSHGNLIANCVALEQHLGGPRQRIGCTWLPPYHDMGLMGAILLSIYSGITLVILTPAHFIQNPYRWLKAISDHRVNITVAPNFALDLCVNSVTEEEAATLDLSCVEQVFCGAEPVLQSSLDRFCERFSPCGFSAAAFLPCYGMAEATLFVSGKPGAAPPKVARIDTECLAKGRVRQVDIESNPGARVVSCGTVAAGHQVAIVDPQSNTRAAASAVGEIWVQGPSVARGYWQQPTLSEHTFGALLAGEEWRGPFLRTGDLGFMLDGELFIAGRMKDVVIIAGRNLYPQDIERSVTRADESIRTNGVVVFSVSADESAEQLVIVAELSRRSPYSAAALDSLRGKVAAAVAADHGVTPRVVHLTPIGGIPLTTSGKVRRAACKQAFLQGVLPAVQPSIATDVKRLRAVEIKEQHVKNG